MILALTLSASIQVATYLSQPQWADIVPYDWTYYGSSLEDDLLMFWRPARQAGNKIWVRYEFTHDPAEPLRHRSMRALIEADCEQGRARAVQTETFPHPNLLGQGIRSTGESWVYPGPGTMQEGALELICD